MGAYIAQSDLEALFGTKNIAAWSVLDPDADPGTANAARIASAIAFAEGYVEDRFRGGPYAVPFVATGAFPVAFTDILAKIAGVWLYNSRGLRAQTSDESTNRITGFRREAEELIDLYLARTRKAALAPAESSGPTTPFVVGAGSSNALNRWDAKGFYGAGFPPYLPQGGGY